MRKKKHLHPRKFANGGSWLDSSFNSSGQALGLIDTAEAVSLIAGSLSKYSPKSKFKTTGDVSKPGSFAESFESNTKGITDSFTNDNNKMSEYIPRSVDTSLPVMSEIGYTPQNTSLVLSYPAWDMRKPEWGGPYKAYSFGGSMNAVSGWADIAKDSLKLYLKNALINDAAVNASKSAIKSTLSQAPTKANSFDSLIAELASSMGAKNNYRRTDFLGLSTGKKFVNAGVGSLKTAAKGFMQTGNWVGALVGGVMGLAGGVAGLGRAKKLARKLAGIANRWANAANNLQTANLLDRSETLRNRLTRNLARSFVAEGGPLNIANTYMNEYANGGMMLGIVPSANEMAMLNQYLNMKYNNQGDTNSNVYPNSLGTLFAFGGNLGTNGANFTDGLTYFNVPTRHETNPNGGIPLGIAPDGQPNLVEGKEEDKQGEGGEIKWNELEYIFSDRLKPTLALIDKWKLPKAFLDYTYADCVRKSPVIKEAELRPNDPISLDTMDKFLADVSEDLETQKKEKEAAETQQKLDQMSPEELAQVNLGLEQEQALLEQQLLQLELAMQELAMAEQQMPLQEMPQGAELVQPGMAPMGANGGKLYAEGGAMMNPMDSMNGAYGMLENPQSLSLTSDTEDPFPEEVSENTSQWDSMLDASEMSTKELNLTIDAIIEYGKETQDKALIREAKRIKKGSREDKEDFVNETVEEIKAEEEAQRQELQNLQLQLSVPADLVVALLLGPVALDVPLMEGSQELPLNEQLESQQYANGGKLNNNEHLFALGGQKDILELAESEFEGILSPNVEIVYNNNKDRTARPVTYFVEIKKEGDKKIPIFTAIYQSQGTTGKMQLTHSERSLQSLYQWLTKWGKLPKDESYDKFAHSLQKPSIQKIDLGRGSIVYNIVDPAGHVLDTRLNIKDAEQVVNKYISDNTPTTFLDSIRLRNYNTKTSNLPKNSSSIADSPLSIDLSDEDITVTEESLEGNPLVNLASNVANFSNNNVNDVTTLSDNNASVRRPIKGEPSNKNVSQNNPLDSVRPYKTLGPITDFRYWNKEANDYDKGYYDYFSNLSLEELNKVVTPEWWELHKSEFPNFIGANGQLKDITADRLKSTSRGAIDKQYGDLHRLAASIYDNAQSTPGSVAYNKSEVPTAEEELSPVGSSPANGTPTVNGPKYRIRYNQIDANGITTPLYYILNDYDPKTPITSIENVYNSETQSLTPPSAKDEEDYYTFVVGDRPKDEDKKTSSNVKPRELPTLSRYASLFDYAESPYANAPIATLLTAAGNLKEIDAPIHGEFLKYQPTDLLYRINLLNMDANAARRGIMNAANQNTGMLMANLALNNAKSLQAIGEATLNSENENWKRLQETLDLHNGIYRTWDLLAMEADRANMGNNSLKMQAANNIANLLWEEEQNKVGARNATRTNYLNNLSAIGRENLAYNMANSNPALRYYSDPTGIALYKGLMGMTEEELKLLGLLRTTNKNGGCLTIKRKRRKY